MEMKEKMIENDPTAPPPYEAQASSSSTVQEGTTGAPSSSSSWPTDEKQQQQQQQPHQQFDQQASWDKDPHSYHTVDRKLEYCCTTSKCTNDGFVCAAYVSSDSKKKYDKSKTYTDDELRVLQQNGIAITLLKWLCDKRVDDHLLMEIYTFIPPQFGTQDFENEYKLFGTVKRYCYPWYDCFVFQIYPDPTRPDQHQISFNLFSHAVHPISDYIYNGERHRWVDEEKYNASFMYHQHHHHHRKRSMGLFRSKPEYEFQHTLLRHDQPSLTDFWNGRDNYLEMDSSSPLLNPAPGKKGTMLGDFYGWQDFGKLTVKSGRCPVLTIRDTQARSDLDPECVMSVGTDALVSACISKVLLHQKIRLGDDPQRDFQLSQLNHRA
ncbi:uncharacterized protein LODBEIA_P60600 [Lodderomyces beijingensis]|uniref:Uncharacterized protein n=1 Tax=Lodderomyces beijingensis TaxID=1775926 RepID=A0ABP0ZWA9_9ASCO